jgi:hypothetical protein
MKLRERVPVHVLVRECYPRNMSLALSLLARFPVKRTILPNESLLFFVSTFFINFPYYLFRSAPIGFLSYAGLFGKLFRWHRHCHRSRVRATLSYSCLSFSQESYSPDFARLIL